MVTGTRWVRFGLGAIFLWAAAGQAATAPLTGDAFFAPGNAGLFGGTATVNVGGALGFQGLLQFDLSKLPPGTTASSVSSATLRLFVNKIGTAGSVDVYAANGPWTESTVTGSNGPTAGNLIAGGVTVGSAGSYVVIPVTSQVTQWIAGAVNYGFLLKADPTAASVFFDSKESTSTSHPAILEIELTPPAGPQGNPGPAGSTGPAGPTGPNGPAGPAGLAGAAGPAGTVTGPVGPQGPAGIPGATGLAGATGPMGSTGPAGQTGATGPAGLTGQAGPAGASGPTGPQGQQGSQGPGGPAGQTGPTGPQGAIGSAGPTGATGAAGAPGATGPIGTTGPTGATGALGNQGLQGNTGATGPTGPQGLITNAFSMIQAVATGAVFASSGAGSQQIAPTGLNYFVMNNTCPCVSDLQSGNPGRSITLPSASARGPGGIITLITQDYSANGGDLFIFPSGSDLILIGPDVINSSQTGTFTALDVFYGATFISDGTNWHVLETN